MTSETDRLRQADLRHLLNQRDPIGVADLVEDEYDCLLAALWSRLTRGTSRASLSEDLWFELQDCFGRVSVRCGTDLFADWLVAWAATWSA